MKSIAEQFCSGIKALYPYPDYDVDISVEYDLEG